MAAPGHPQYHGIPAGLNMAATQQAQAPVMGPGQGNPQQQQQGQQPQATAQQQQQQPEIDPLVKFQKLLPRLRDSLVNLFKNAGTMFYQNARQDENGIPIDMSGRFEKCLEEFYSICDQIEINLRLAHEVMHQDRDSARNTPSSVVPPKTDNPQQQHAEGRLYSEYLATVRTQIGCAKDIRDALHECLRNFPEHS